MPLIVLNRTFFDEGAGMVKRVNRFAVVLVAVLAGTAGIVVVATSAGPARAATNTLLPVADTYVDNSHTTTNYGTSGQLGVDSSETKRLYLKFSLAGITGPITSAKLRLHVDDVSGAESPAGGTYSLMNNTSWTESAVTWNAQPAIDGVALGALGSVARNAWYEIDVTGKIAAGGIISIGGSSSNTNGADFDSRETGTTAPQLVIETGTTTPTTPPPTTAPAGDPVLVGAGDIATSGSGDSATAALVNAIPGTVFTMGDNVYNSGTAGEFNSYYNPTWGQFKARTKPAPGNHDYVTSGASGYYGYFGTLAGPSGRGYYSYDLGNWHIVSLNSEVSMASGSAQHSWLTADLDASSKPCTLAYWHKPLFTSGANHAPETATRPLFQVLYDHNADVLVTGHNHQYERFAPMNPSGTADNARGIREFVAGMGGADHYSFGSIQPNSQVRNSDTFGVVKFTLHSNSYDWTFVPEAGKSFTDSGTTNCH
jgi:hypothetical protein